MRDENANANVKTTLMREMLTLRAEWAKLLGFTSHADFVLDNSIANPLAAAIALLRQVFDPALVRAREKVCRTRDPLV
jgi:peptidyl-dipeptidase Dcp